jgi:predicted transcriptional regulator
MSASVLEAAAWMTRDKVTWLPVTGPTGWVGIVSAGDIVCRSTSQGKSPEQCQVSEVMTLGVICCRGSDAVMGALRLINRHGVYQLGVLDENDRLSGIVTVSRLIRTILATESTER